MADQSVTIGGAARPAFVHPPHRQPHGGAARGLVRSGEGGQATLLVSAALVLALVTVMVLGRMGVTAARAARSQAAADATALAAVQAGVPAARRVAAANGAEVVSVRLEPGWAQVVVARQGATATATAALVPDADDG